jgi:ATP/maltotriose-dependent transcriptional regulator MalT
VTAFIRLGQQRLSDARASAIRAADGARAVGDLATLEQALVSIDHAETFMGMPCDGDHTREALEICIANGWKARESVARCNLGNFAFFAGRWAEAVEDYRSSRQAAMESGNAFGAYETDVNLGEVLVNLGRADEARSVLRDAARVLRASGVEFNASYAEMLLARASLALGEFEQAEAEIAPLVERFTAMGTRLTAFEAVLVRAEIATSAGEPARAMALLDAGEEAARGEVAPLRARLCWQRGAASLALGDLDGAARMLDEGLAVAREQDLPFEEALLLLTASRLAEARGDRDGATAMTADADWLLARLGVQGADRGRVA